MLTAASGPVPFTSRSSREITKPRVSKRKESEREREKERAGAASITVHSQSREHHAGQRLGKKPKQNTAWEPKNTTQRVRESEQGEENKDREG